MWKGKFALEYKAKKKAKEENAQRLYKKYHPECNIKLLFGMNHYYYSEMRDIIYEKMR